MSFLFNQLATSKEKTKLQESRVARGEDEKREAKSRYSSERLRQLVEVTSKENSKLHAESGNGPGTSKREREPRKDPHFRRRIAENVLYWGKTKNREYGEAHTRLRVYSLFPLPLPQLWPFS
jgi:hypothetical protein